MRKIVDHYKQEERWFLAILTVLCLLTIIAVLTACGDFKGDRGYDGTPGQAGPRGEAGIDGQQGSAGNTGTPGSTGAQGPAGADGKIATVVQLCPGTPVYGSVYVETAICINNQLYGVYSANGGFLTLLTPGAYSSNAIGSACSLTVLPNCEIQ